LTGVPGLVVLGFVLRLAWVLAVPSRPVGDFAMYRESASYLLEHGALDPEFIYMPGYVFLLAGVEALGGGLLAAKMLGVLAGTAMVAAAGGIAERLFGRRAGLVAAALAALWPAGIAVTSVTGTDLPAGALVALAVLALVRLGPRRPWWAAVLCGLIFGAGAWVRAVAVPLAALSLLYWWALERRFAAALARTAVVVAIAAMALLPWGLRNRAVYGEFFLTDSHGGHTALVGANPNSEGTYSRSLNVMFTKGTGYRLLETPARHREADRAAYALAKQWSAFEPAYALGLLAAKADRLLSHERNLLYWPIYRQGVLPATARGFLDRHRGAIEFVADAYWWLMVALFAAGVVLAARRRELVALALLAFPAAMAGIYASFFSEVRYHLAIAPLLFPLAALTLTWMGNAVGPRFRAERRTWFLVGLTVVALFAGWQVMLAGGAALRRHHHWAVTVCSYPEAGQTHLCAWRERLPPGGDSRVRGTWDGVGIALRGDARGELLGAVRTQLPLAPGRYRVRALVAGPAGRAGEIAVSGAASDTVFGRVLVPADPKSVETVTLHSGEVWLEGAFDHPGGTVNLDFNLESVDSVGSAPAGVRSEAGMVWISELLVERFPALDIIPRR
jgi:4-amino-4-deoxy-L-arabinose transferase-like glycosyltransferase